MVFYKMKPEKLFSTLFIDSLLHHLDYIYNMKKIKRNYRKKITYMPNLPNIKSNVKKDAGIDSLADLINEVYDRVHIERKQDNNTLPTVYCHRLDTMVSLDYCTEACYQPIFNKCNPFKESKNLS